MEKNVLCVAIAENLKFDTRIYFMAPVYNGPLQSIATVWPSRHHVNYKEIATRRGLLVHANEPSRPIVYLGPYVLKLIMQYF